MVSFDRSLVTNADSIALSLFSMRPVLSKGKALSHAQKATGQGSNDAIGPVLDYDFMLINSSVAGWLFTKWQVMSTKKTEVGALGQKKSQCTFYSVLAYNLIR